MEAMGKARNALIQGMSKFEIGGDLYRRSRH